MMDEQDEKAHKMLKDYVDSFIAQLKGNPSGGPALRPHTPSPIQSPIMGRPGALPNMRQPVGDPSVVLSGAEPAAVLARAESAAVLAGAEPITGQTGVVLTNAS